MISLLTCSWVSVRRWDVKIIDLPFFLIDSRKCQRSLRFRKSRPTKGSSRIRIFGSWSRERIMFSLTFCPPESSVGFLFISSDSFNININSFAFFIAVSSEIPSVSPVTLMLSKTERSGMNASSCGTKPIFDLLKIFDLPKILILPVCFVPMIPATSFRKVDLPDPDFPMIATSSFSLRLSEMSLSTS